MSDDYKQGWHDSTTNNPNPNPPQTWPAKEDYTKGNQAGEYWKQQQPQPQK